jgi:hypothetical protein
MQSSSSSDEEEGKPKIARVFMIQCFGLNEKGRRVVYLSGISSRFVKVADNWTQQMAATLLYDIRANSAVGPYYKNMIESATLVEHNKLYGFSGKLTNS